MSPKVLFVAYGGGHIRMLLPVLQELRARGRIEPVLMALTTAAPVARAEGWCVRGFADLIEVDSKADQAALSLGATLAADLPTPPVEEKETHAYLGLSYQDLVVTVGELEAAREYQQYGRQAFNPVRTMRRAIQAMGVRGVVATNSPRAERASIQAARELGLPSVCLVDLFAIDEVAWIGQAGYADCVCVLNAAVRAFLLKHGRKDEEVVVTGNPAFDGLNDPRLRAAGEVLRMQMLADGGQKILLFASSPEPATHPFRPGVVSNPCMHSEVAQKVRQWQLANPSWQCWLKPHPSQAALMGQTHEGLRVCDPKWPLHAVLHATDAVLVMTSTVAVEAAQVGKPVVRVRGSMFDDATPFEAMGICRAGCELVDLPQMLTRELTHGLAAGTTQPSPWPIEKASVAVADQIERVVCI